MQMSPCIRVSTWWYANAGIKKMAHIVKVNIFARPSVINDHIDPIAGNQSYLCVPAMTETDLSFIHTSYMGAIPQAYHN